MDRGAPPGPRGDVLRMATRVVRDITFRYNRVDNVEGGFNIAERYDGSATSGSRFTITQNLITNVGFSDSGDLDRLFVKPAFHGQARGMPGRPCQLPPPADV